MRALPLIFCRTLVALALPAISGCDRTADDARDAGPEPTPIRIVTTVYPLADVARRVGGKRVTVEWLRESGQGPEALDADPARRARLRSADIVVTSGAAHAWTLEGSDNAYSAQRIIRLDSLPSAQGAPGDAYLWLNPQVAKDLADALRVRLATLDPKRETFFLENARQFTMEVDGIITGSAAATAPLKGSTFASIDPGFAPLATWAGMLPMRIADAPPRAVSDDVTRRLRDALPSGTDKSARVFFAGEDTRFLGDLYQDLSEAVRKRYALLQTPEFVEEFR